MHKTEKSRIHLESILRTATFTETRPPTSRHTQAADFSRPNPRRPNTTHSRARYSVVSTRTSRREDVRTGRNAKREEGGATNDDRSNTRNTRASNRL